MRIFDTDTLPVRDRADAMADALLAATYASHLTPSTPREHAYLQMSSWDLDQVELVEARCSAMTIRRTVRQAAGADRPVLSICVEDAARGLYTGQHRIEVRPHSMFAVDLTRPYVYRLSDARTTVAKVPLEALGLPADRALRAIPHVDRSPLAGLVGRHLRDVRAVADDLDPSAARVCGEATMSMCRALLASVAGHDGLARQTLEDTLLTRVKAFVDDHLQDRELDAAMVAAAHYVSVRHLYSVCARADVQLEQWIIARRLERAKADLSGPGRARSNVGVVAHRWGFVNSSHFAGRFRAAYGMSPREWQQHGENAQVSRSGSSPRRRPSTLVTAAGPA